MGLFLVCSLSHTSYLEGSFSSLPFGAFIYQLHNIISEEKKTPCCLLYLYGIHKRWNGRCPIQFSLTCVACLGDLNSCSLPNSVWFPSPLLFFLFQCACGWGSRHLRNSLELVAPPVSFSLYSETILLTVCQTLWTLWGSVFLMAFHWLNQAWCSLFLTVVPSFIASSFSLSVCIVVGSVALFFQLHMWSTCIAT